MSRASTSASPAATPPSAPLSALRGLLPFLRPYRARVALAFVLLCLGSAAILVVPLAFRDLIDAGFGGVSAGGGAAREAAGLFGAQGLDGRFVALFGLAVFWAAAVAARYYTVSWIGERVSADLRSAVYARVLRQSPQFFETLQTGEVLSRLTGDTTLVQTVVGSSISLGLRSLFQFVGGMVMLAVTSVQLFGLIFGLMALLALPITLIGRRVRSLSREAQDRIADASALAGEILNAMPTVQAFGQEANEAARFAARADDALRVRPLPGVHFTLDDRSLTICRGGEPLPGCEASTAWVEAVALLKRDLFSGAQHALGAPERLRGLQTVELEVHEIEASAVTEEILPGNDNDV